MNSLTPKKKYSNLSKLGVVTTKYGGKTRYEGFHKGIDIANKEGTPIPAFEGGKVLGINPGHQPGENNYGNSIIIRDKHGNVHRYSHLQKINVKPGQVIKKDENIGNMGQTGSAYSPTGEDASHLDYRLVDAYNKYKNPSKYVKKYVNKGL